MTGSLNVTTSHVRELSAKQQEAAAQLQTATSSADGIEVRLWRTHGLICFPSTIAATFAHQARTSAGTRLKASSMDLHEKLTHAADKYDEVDRQQREYLDNQIPNELHPMGDGTSTPLGSLNPQ